MIDDAKAHTALEVSEHHITNRKTLFGWLRKRQSSGAYNGASGSNPGSAAPSPTMRRERTASNAKHGFS
jgi:hypothetical protein